MKNGHKVVKTLRTRYLTALSIIAAIIVLSQVLIQYNIMKEADDSRVINLAGRQRMLSQKITKTMLVMERSMDTTERSAYLEELRRALDLWVETHEGLKFGNAELQLPGRNSDEVVRMFKELDPHHKAMVEAVGEFIRISDTGTDVASNDGREAMIKVVLLNEPDFLRVMDAIVFQYDAEAKAKVNRIAVTEAILMVIALGVLLLEARFIFFPAEQHITEALDSLQRKEDSVRKLFDIAPSAMFLVRSSDYDILRLNVMACEMIGLTFNKAIGRKFYDFVSGEYLEALKTADDECYHGEMKQLEAVLRSEDGESLVMLMSVARMEYEGEPIFLVGLSDITDRKRHEDALRELATTDDMTGLLNRRTGLLLVTKEMEKAYREIYDLAVCFIDLDGLKRVNDDYGHTEGDWFIKSIASILLRNIRWGDVVFRYGGDEMIVLLSNCTGDEAEIIMKRIEVDVQHVNKIGEKPYAISLSYGICDYRIDRPADMDDFLAKADERMYAQKQQKKMARN